MNGMNGERIRSSFHSIVIEIEPWELIPDRKGKVMQWLTDVRAEAEVNKNQHMLIEGNELNK